MSDIEFNIDKENDYLKQQLDSNYQKDESFSLVNFLIKKEITKDAKQADIFLVICVMIIIAFSIYIFSNISTGRKLKYTEEELKYVNSLNKNQAPAQYDAILFSN